MESISRKRRVDEDDRLEDTLSSQLSDAVHIRRKSGIQNSLRIRPSRRRQEAARAGLKVQIAGDDSHKL